LVVVDGTEGVKDEKSWIDACVGGLLNRCGAARAGGENGVGETEDLGSVGQAEGGDAGGDVRGGVLKR